MNNSIHRLNKSDLILQMERKFGDLSPEIISDAVELLLQEIINRTALDDRVEIRGFGVFSKKILDRENLLIPKPRKSRT